jgi:hypothetical protein
VITAARKPGEDTRTQLASTDRRQPDRSRPRRDSTDAVRVESWNRGPAQIRVIQAATPPGRSTGLAPSYGTEPPARLIQSDPMEVSVEPAEPAAPEPPLHYALRSDDTDARSEARRCFGRSDRRAQGGSPMLRSIRPTRAMRGSATPPVAASECHDKPSYWPLTVPAREAGNQMDRRCHEDRVAGRTEGRRRRIRD